MTIRSPRSLLVTGGAGFIGSNLTRYLLKTDPQARVTVFDALTPAGNLANLEGLSEAYGEGKGAGAGEGAADARGQRYTFVRGNICDPEQVAAALIEHSIDTIVHLAAESHVDRSIDDPLSFVSTNLLGTAVLLEQARRAWAGRQDVLFHHVSTDEVFGSLETGQAAEQGPFTEQSPYDPSSPYSATKAGSDHLVRAWHRTYGLPVTLSSCSNNYGPNQFPEKLIPLILIRALAGEPLPVYGDGSNVRDWIYVEDHCWALDLILRRGRVGQTYNIGAGVERQNIELVRQLCGILDEERPRSAGNYAELITFVTDRPAHDLRYAVDNTKIQTELGWRPEVELERGLRQTVQWYLEHEAWVEEIRARTDAGERLGL